MTLISREILFGAPATLSPMLSPDGERLAYLRQDDGVVSLWVGRRDAWQAATAVAAGPGLAHYAWCHDGRHIVFPRDEAGDENWHVISLDVDTGALRDLTPWPGVAAGVAALSPRRPGEVLLMVNRRDPAVHDLWLADLDTGDTREVFRNPGFPRLIVDRDFAVRLALQALPDGAMRYLAATPGGGWQPFLDVEPEDALTTAPITLTEDGRGVYVFDSRDRNIARLVRLDLGDGGLSVVADHPEADIVDILMHPGTSAVQAVVTDRLRRTWHPCDSETAEDLAVLAAAEDGDLHVLSRSRDLSWWVVSHAHDTGATRFSLYDRRRRTVEPLFSARPELDALPLVPMRPLTLRSRDGLDLVSYLSRPAQAGPHPLVLLVHGGPWGRVSWGYDATTQWLVNRGFAVLTVNFRGSTGFGKAFLNAGDREWGRAMQTDLIDAADWAVAEGIADPHRLVIMGGSYGGYAVLRALTETPETFACGIALCPPLDLIGFLENVPPYWAGMSGTFTRRIGDVHDPEGRAMLAERSPAAHLDRIVRPLFFAHGANDVRVLRRESDRLATSLRARGIPHLYALYENEGHMVVRPENIAAFHALAEVFLAEVLGTPAEPYDPAEVPPALRLSGTMLGLG